MTTELPPQLQASILDHKIVKFGLIPQGDPGYSEYRKNNNYMGICSCGERFKFGSILKDGVNLNTWARTHWLGHLSCMEEIDLVVDVARITKPGSTVLLQVMTTVEAIARGFPLPDYLKGPCWVVSKTTTTTTGKVRRAKITHAYAEKEDAIWKAEAIARREDQNGTPVEYLLESTYTETKVSAATALMDLADDALETADLQTIEDARSQLAEFFGMVKLLEGKRDAVEALRNKILLGA